VHMLRRKVCNVLTQHGVSWTVRLCQETVLAAISRHLRSVALPVLPRALEPLLVITRGFTRGQERAERAAWAAGSRIEARPDGLGPWVPVTVQSVESKDEVERLYCKPTGDSTNHPLFTAHRWDSSGTRPVAPTDHARALNTSPHWYRSAPKLDLLQMQSNLLGLTREMLLHECTAYALLQTPFLAFHVSLALLPPPKEMELPRHEVESRSREACRWLDDALRSPAASPEAVLHGMELAAVISFDHYTSQFPTAGSSSRSVSPSPRAGGRGPHQPKRSQGRSGVVHRGLSLGNILELTTTATTPTTPTNSSSSNSSKKEANDKIGSTSSQHTTFSDANNPAPAREEERKQRGREGDEGGGGGGGGDPQDAAREDQGQKASDRLMALLHYLLRWSKQVQSRTL